ncbi:membrane integrity-associated transporter subunit PqiC [Pseudooceanicola marinus]|uniref:PqiC family protein n=1 Tax=Pseudooceanicola marinus TaxID=396013 RepID=UPI001C97DE96|nr:PqiC family protein [Pseudooceanicola marinus]MBY5972480.1 PqiC family protein [Ferrimonas balearica]MCA1335625.1 PqiC family protein [Pseudooceanicola marinus]
MRHLILATSAALALASCAADERFYTVPDVAPETLAPVSIRYSSVEVLEVSLPDYAERQQIARRQADGAVAAETDVLWADLPSRGMSLELARHLGRITGVQVAGEPWPFNDRAQARLEVRVEQMLAEADGTFRLSGQYFVAPDLGGRGRTGLFDITVPVAGPGPSEIAAARAQAVAELAGQVARDGLR